MEFLEKITPNSGYYYPRANFLVFKTIQALAYIFAVLIVHTYNVSTYLQTAILGREISRRNLVDLHSQYWEGAEGASRPPKFGIIL